jgi:hypothetical protein
MHQSTHVHLTNYYNKKKVKVEKQNNKQHLKIGIIWEKMKRKLILYLLNDVVEVVECGD